MRKLSLLVLITVFSFYSNAQTTLAPGDIAFIGFNLDGVDDYAFILLKDVDASTTINFTDYGWTDGTGFVSNTGESAQWTWSAGAARTCGTVINVTVNAPGFAADLGTVSGTSPVFSGLGDQIFAFQGTPSSPLLIAGINSNESATDANWNGSCTNNQTSALPDVLTNGVNAIRLHNSGSEVDNWQYNCAVTSGDVATVRSAINNVNNWVNDNLNAYTPANPGCTWSVTCVSAFTWDGSTSTDWNVASNWSTNSVPTSSDDVVIPSAPSNQPHVTLDPASPAVCNNITIESGATLTIDAGKALTVSGDTDNDGTILIEADATGIGSFIDNGTITGSGSFQMEQYLTGSGGGTPDGVFYYVSSPIPNATAADYNVASGNKLWIDQEATQDYAQLTFGAIGLDVGQGYIARMGSTGVVTFNGSSYNTGNITEGSLTRTGTIELNRGYNLVGNPYPSTVNWDNLGRTNLETTMWYRTNNAGTMTFDTYNASGMVGTNNNGGGTVDGTIPPTQAFWVRVDADGNTGSVSFENTDRSHGTLAGIYKVESEEGTVRLSLSNGTISDEQVIYFDASADDQLDDYDSRKFWASGIPQLYSNIQEDTLTINGLNSPQTTEMVPLGMKLPTQGNYSLDATNITLVSTPAILEDAYLNVFQDLNAEPNYSFTSDAGNIGDRFILHFSNAAVGIDEAKSNIIIYSSGDRIHINRAEASQATVTVLDLSARIIHTETINSQNATIQLNAPTGIYLVRLETEANTTTNKLTIQ